MHFPVPCYPGQWTLKSILFAAGILLCAQQEGSLQNANGRSCAPVHSDVASAIARYPFQNCLLYTSRAHETEADL
eukprot:742537-Rhodomonas_salina.1